MADIELDYDHIMQNALRHVVKDVLTITSDLKETPGDHHFYIEFMTTASGVIIPDHLRATYPERMTIVLHHQFENLDVTDEGFGVTLWFKGIETRLEIPFVAITSFADPSAKFGLRFQEDDDDPREIAPDADQSGKLPEQAIEEPTPINGSHSKKKPSGKAKSKDEKSDGSADVVSLDSFRKK